MFNHQENIDYLAELVVSQLLLNKELDDEKIHVHMLGVFKRFFSNDVEKIETHNNSRIEKDWHIYLNREGIYDLLPEGFFHGHSQKYYKDQKETISEFRKHRAEETNARLLFKPLEQEFFHHLVSKEIFEQNCFNAPQTIREFVEFFNLGHCGLNAYQQSALFFMLPHIPKIVGNIGLTETCFEIILQEKITFRMMDDPIVFVENSSGHRLGNTSLSIDTVLGDICINQNPVLKIEIGPLKEGNLLLHFLDGKYMDLINRLIDLFIQADITTKVNVMLKEADQVFVLGEHEYEGRLNYSTTI